MEQTKTFQTLLELTTDGMVKNILYLEEFEQIFSKLGTGVDQLNWQRVTWIEIS